MNAQEQLIATKIARLKGMTKTEYYEFLEANAKNPLIEIRDAIKSDDMLVKFVDDITTRSQNQVKIKKS